MGSFHPADPDRGRRRHRLRGSGRGRFDVGTGGRGDGHRQAHRHRLALDAAQCRAEACAGDQGEGRQDRQAASRRRRALRAARRIDHLVRAGRNGARGRRDRAHLDQQRQDARHHGRSAAGGGAVRGATAEGPRHHRRDLGHSAVRARLQEQAALDDRAERGRRRVRSST